MRVREALASFMREAAEDAVYRWRDGEPPSHAAHVQRHRWVTSSDAGGALDEAAGLGLVDDVAREALRAQLVRARISAVMAPARDSLEACGRGELDLPDARPPLRAAVEAWPVSPPGRRRAFQDALARVASQAWPSVDDALAEARSHLAALAHPDAGPDAEVLVARAMDVLESTDDAAEAIVAWLEAGDLGGLLHALRAQPLDGLFPPQGRWQRIAQDTTGLGFERELGARVRVERVRSRLSPRVRVAPVDPPRDVRLGPGAGEHGLVSEVAAAEGLGRALALALASVGLPVELRWPLEGTLPRAVGGAFAQVLGEPAALERGRRMGKRERERVSRTVGAIVLLETRACAASVVAWAEDAPSDAARRDLACEWLRRALRVDVDPPWAPWIIGTPWGASARLRGRLGSLAAWHALRERYDEDWYRNPRCAEAIRSGAHSGGRLSVEAWLEGELGASQNAHGLRLRELASKQC